MGSARRCLAAAARQLKVNMKKIQIDTLYNWKPVEFRGKKKKERDIECSHFVPDLPLFAFVGLFSLPCSLPRVICFLTPSPSLVVQTDTIQQKKGQPDKIQAPHLFFQNRALLLIKQAVVKEPGYPSAAARIPCNGTSQGVGFFPSWSLCE